jgi:hypothetical protein
MSIAPARSSRPFRRVAVPLLLCAAATATAATAVRAADGYAADDAYLPRKRAVSSPITDRFALRATYIPATVHTVLRVDPKGVPLGGTTLSAERDLGLASSNPDGRLELMARLGERNRLRVDYVQLDRSGNAQLGRTIVFGDETFLANEEAHTTLNWKMMGFTYTRALVQTDRFEAGAGLGIHLIQVDAIGAVPALFESHETSEVGAFPTIALEAMWRISRRFAFTGRGQYFGTTINGFTGSLGDYHGDFQYRWRSALAIGVGYSYMRASFQSLTHGTPGRFTLSMAGPELFARVAF